MRAPAKIDLLPAGELAALPRPPAFVRTKPLSVRNRRFLFYSHDGLGLGHVRRNLAVAAALTELAPEASVLLAASTREVEQLGVPPNVDVLKLPGLRKLGNERYSARRLRIPPRDVRALRSALLAAAVASFDPAVVLVDKHPIGAGGELRAALQIAREAGARLVLGLRDILDDPVVVIQEWAASGAADRISELYDRVLVYGHPSVLDPVREYGLPPSVGERTRFCGYVLGPDALVPDLGRTLGIAADGRPLVLATTGGGEDGFDLLRIFVEAASGAPWAGVVVTGPECGDAAGRQLRSQCERAGVVFRTFVPRLASAFSTVDALVCMGGYNTLTEALASGVRTVCVPRVHPRKEQLLRAQAFARLGAITLVEPERLSAAVLGAEIDASLRSPRPAGEAARPVIDLEGARRSAHHLVALAAEHSAPAAARRLRGVR